MFNADAFVGELGAPQLKLDGRTYVGRILSFEEFAPFEERSNALDAPTRTRDERWRAEFQAFAADYLRTIFPRPPWWHFWWRDPVPRMLAHPGLLAGLTDFFGIQARALQKMMGGASPKTAGSDSAPKIAVA